MKKDIEPKTINIRPEEVESITLPGTIPLEVLAGNMAAMDAHFKEKAEKQRLLRKKEEEHIREIIDKIKKLGSEE